MQSYSISFLQFCFVLVKAPMIFFLFRCSNLALTTSLVTHKSQLTRMVETSTRITTSSTSRTLASTTVWLTCTLTQGEIFMPRSNFDHFERRDLLQEQQHQVCDQTEPVLPQPEKYDIYGELMMVLHSIIFALNYTYNPHIIWSAVNLKSPFKF